MQCSTGHLHSNRKGVHQFGYREVSKISDSRDQKAGSVFGFLRGGGELAELVSKFDWQATSLGPIETWAPCLKNTVSLILQSKVPMVILWGPDGYMIYNDAYAVFAAARHPRLLGSKVLEGWPEVASFNAHVMDVVLGGGTLSFQDQELVLYRDNRPENVWMNLDYSPVLDEAGNPAGVIAIVVETTAKVAAEAWRRSERDRQSRMFEQAPGFLAMMTGSNHVFELANASYRQLAGHRELLGKTVREAFPEIEHQGFFDILDQVFATGEPFVGKALKATLQPSPDQEPEEHFIDLVYQPIRDPDSRIIGILAQGIDVTDRLRTEQALRQSEERFRALTDAMPNHVWTSRPDGQLDWFNPRVYEYSGALAGELQGEGWAKLVHPDDLHQAKEKWASAIASDALYEAEFRLRRHDGVYRWHVARAVPMHDGSGKIVQWVGTNTDIDDQRRSAEALLESERRLQLSQKAAGVGSMELDIKSGNVIGSEQLWKIWGLSDRESVHLSVLEDIVLPEDAHIRSNPETRRTGTADAHVEYRIRRPDNGQIRWLSRNIKFVLDENGTPVKMYGIMQDITERKDAEARQQMLAHELEHRIKNILSMVGAIVSQTLRVDDIDTAREALQARIRALAGAHDILNKTRWTNASILDVVRSAIAVFPSDRVSVSGPDLNITPRMAISLGLAVNELGTNAVKYGALSVDGGRVEIKWSITPDSPDAAGEFTWSWREIGGPPVARPTRRGFGTVLIDRVLGADFGGTVQTHFDEAGIRCILTAPASEFETATPENILGLN